MVRNDYSEEDLKKQFDQTFEFIGSKEAELMGSEKYNSYVASIILNKRAELESFQKDCALMITSLKQTAGFIPLGNGQQAEGHIEEIKQDFLNQLKPFLN